jgi:hypothetical protein
MSHDERLTTQDVFIYNPLFLFPSKPYAIRIKERDLNRPQTRQD